MNFLQKLQQQPETVRKIIAWVVVITLGLLLITLWARNSYNKIKEFNKEGTFKEMIPSFENLDEASKLELPAEVKENIEELNKLIEQREQQLQQ